MSKCIKCKIDVNGKHKHCPFCDAELTGNFTEDVYPQIKRERKSIINKLVIFISLLIAMVSLFTEYYVNHNFKVSKYVIFGLLTHYLVVRYILKRYSHILVKINRQFFLIMMLFIMWYFITKASMIPTYFIPILSLVIGLINAVILLIYGKKFVSKFGGIILFNTFIGFIPTIFALAGACSINIISYVSTLFYIIIFTGVFIFYKKNMLDTIEKTFNI